MITPPIFRDANCVGMFYRDDGGAALAAARELQPGDILLLEREPDNAHDQNAIKTILEDHTLHLGYVGRGTAAWMSYWLDAGWTYIFIVEKVGENRGNPLVSGRCEPVLSAKEPAETETSAEA